MLLRKKVFVLLIISFEISNTNLTEIFSYFSEPIMELRVGNKYRLGRKIGSGSFGDIYLGEIIDFSFISTDYVFFFRSDLFDETNICPDNVMGIWM